jgi:valyl-tRNA synthetase
MEAKPLCSLLKNVRFTPIPAKDLSAPMAPAYEPSQVEAGWQEWWDQSHFFTPDAQAARGENKFVMMIPPPNVTGALHIGHALFVAIQDTLARWHRMKGEHTLWLPGIDHAGIATQSVVERQLLKLEGLTRHDLGRDLFLERVWQWKEEYGGRIFQQMKHLGVSVDWTRQAFTMDAKLSRAVTEAFVQLWDKGLVYRSNRLVNWSCHLKTALSDLEVDSEELKGSTHLSIPGYDKRIEFGVMHEFAYKVQDSDEEVVVATTRIETMLGDVAVAVHPADPRFAHLIGKRLVHPFIPEREVLIVADDILVDMAIGTGAVKITPAHDYNDYECGKRHGLPIINILSEEGKINENGGQYAGMRRFDCRKKIITDLEALGLYKGKKNHEMRLGICSRSGDAIEPYLKPQWYVNCTGMAERACEAVRSNALQILPKQYEATWFRWLENIKDWCVSRQLWWGHRIPAYIVKVKSASGELYYEPQTDVTEHWVVGRTYEEALERAQKLKREESDTVELSQDEDVLDTWFSSGLFPFSTLGWPNTEDADFQGFYPGTILETGTDILFFWVARMVMMGQELTGQLPFKTVYLHPIVRDSQGRKISKSLGNVIDPLEIISGVSLESLLKKLYEGNLDPKELKRAETEKRKEFAQGIPECGADALRFGMLAYMVQGRSINLDIKRVIGYRQFCNKLWNAVKFALVYLPEGFVPDQDFLALKAEFSTVDRWILSRLNKAIEAANIHLSEYSFGEVVQALFNFWLYEVCDVYLEAIKPVMRSEGQAKHIAQNILYLCLDVGLRLMHPMTPFITEELYQRLPKHEDKAVSISIARYPEPIPALADSEVEAAFAKLLEVVGTIRSIMASLSIFGKRPRVFIRSSSPYVETLVQGLDLIATLAKAGSAELVGSDSPAGCVMNLTGHDTEVFLEVTGIVNVEAEVKKLERKLQQAKKYIETIDKKRQVPNFEQKTPAEIKQDMVERREASEQEVHKLTEEIERLRLFTS